MQARVCIHVQDARQMEPNPPARCQHQSNGITCSEVRTLIVKRVQLMQHFLSFQRKCVLLCHQVAAAYGNATGIAIYLRRQQATSVPVLTGNQYIQVQTVF